MLGVSGRAMLKALSEGEYRTRRSAGGVGPGAARRPEARLELEEAVAWGLMGRSHQRFMLAIQLDRLSTAMDGQIETLDLEVGL